jgi:hypothetical protein
MTLATALFGVGVKSVQAGTIALSGVTSNTATISSVNTNKSVVLYGGITTTDTTGTLPPLAYLTLTNATTVTATRATSSNTTTVSYTVLEFY